MEHTSSSVMDEEHTLTDAGLMFPSPNWFLPRVMDVSTDGWVVFGSMVRGICALIPRGSGTDTAYRIYIAQRAHAERVTCVELSEGWTEKRRFLSGSTDGFVKQWVFEDESGVIRMRPLNAHNAHKDEKEEIVGLGYSGDDHVISVGSSGVIAKWNYSTNITRVYRKLMKGMKPVSVACCPHTQLRLAVGTKQGVLFVIDLHNSRQPQVLLKVRGHDDEITSMCWCPQVNVTINKAVKFSLANRLDKIRQERAPKSEMEEKFGNGSTQEDLIKTSNSVEENHVKKVQQNEDSEVAEDDMFDIYTDFAADEFGHKKFQSEEILVPVEKPTIESDFLAECMKLKKDILESKNKPEESIHSLVQSLEKASINKDAIENRNAPDTTKKNEMVEDVNDDHETAKMNSVNGDNGSETSEKQIHNNLQKDLTEYNSHESQSYANLLATFDKTGKVCLWTNRGKLIGSSLVPAHRSKQTGKPSPCSGLHWPRADLLLMSDSRDNLLECNPQQIDSNNKIEWKILHSIHKRGMYCIASGAPKRQSADSEIRDYPVWTVGQDRSMVHYSQKDRKQLAVYATLGAFVYAIAPCPYDSQKLAIGAGDGAMRIYTFMDGPCGPGGRTTSYWQNVQGKVLTVAWHPTRENQVAFGTAEGRVGLIDVSGTSERPARVIGPPLSRGVYSVSWGERNTLYMCSVGRLLSIDTGNHKAVANTIEVEFEGKRWSPTEAAWHERALCVGGRDGEVGLLTPHPPHHMLAADFHFKKQVHCIVWHPQGVTLAPEETPYKNWLAANAAENHIVVLELCEEDGKFKLKEMAIIRGHAAAVVRTAWSPHHNGRLLSTSQDATVRVWNISSSGEVSCMAVYHQHVFSTLAAAWCPRPQDSHLVLSGGGDCSLRLWAVHAHPPHLYTNKSTSKSTFDMAKPEEQSASRDPAEDTEKNGKFQQDHDERYSDEEVVALATTTTRPKPKLYRAHLFPISHSQHSKYALRACRKMLQKHLDKCGGEGAAVVGGGEHEEGLDFMKLFGSQDEFNELLDQEQERHLSRDHLDKWMVVGVMRGEIERVFKMAVARAYISPLLLALAPMVSHRVIGDLKGAVTAVLCSGSVFHLSEAEQKEQYRTPYGVTLTYDQVTSLEGFWKDAVQAFIAQSEKEKCDSKVTESVEENDAKLGGKPHIFTVTNHLLHKMLLLLSQHDVMGAIRWLRECNMYREAYVLARVRHMHAEAAALLDAWAEWAYSSGNKHIASHCYMTLGKLVEASTVLSKSSEQELLGLAADIAKCTGQETLAGSLARKSEEASQPNVLESLPERLALHLQARLGDGGEGAPASFKGETASASDVRGGLSERLAALEDGCTAEGDNGESIGNGAKENGVAANAQ